MIVRIELMMELIVIVIRNLCGLKSDLKLIGNKKSEFFCFIIENIVISVLWMSVFNIIC